MVGLGDVLIEIVEFIVSADEILVPVRYVESDCLNCLCWFLLRGGVFDHCRLHLQEVFNFLFPEWLSRPPTAAFSPTILKVIGAVADMVRIVAFAGPQGCPEMP